jgi:penicillin-binding protein 1C
LVIWVSFLSLPDFSSFEDRLVEESTKIYDRTGKILLYDVHKDIRRTSVPLSDISPQVRNATIAIEDSEFYNHSGVRPTAMIRAFFVDVLSGSFEQGGSTITQQVIKNTLLTTDKLITRKIKEVVLAFKLEREKTKDEILELYFNETPYGSTIYGVEEASRIFFGKTAKELTLAESAYLAAIPQAPTRLSPYGKNRERLESRKNLVLTRMVEEGFITKEEAEEAKKEEVVFSPYEDRNLKAPHFVLYVEEYLRQKYGEDVLDTQGLRVITTLDWNLQVKAEKVATQYAETNSKNFNAHNNALVAISPKTGDILAMVGSKDWFGKSEPEGCTSGVDCLFDPQVNIATQEPGRQPGSALKPFIYATLFEKGYTPSTVLFDVPTEFSLACDPYGNPLPGNKKEECYSPENYDNLFRGPMTVRNALAQSINIPAVKALYLAGMKDSLDTMKRMGITTLNDPDRYGLTLVLGGGEISLLELTSAYSVFANNGYKNPHSPILSVENKKGVVLEKRENKGSQVLEAQVAQQINSILSDDTARAPLFGSDSLLSVPGLPVAAKTGTTNNYRDVWIVGYTPDISVGVWTGNNNNTSMERRVAGLIVAPLWRAYIDSIRENLSGERFTTPPTTTTSKPVLNGDWRTGYDSNGNLVSGVHSILYWVDKNNPLGPTPQNPTSDGQFNHWEIPVRAWAQRNGIQDGFPIGTTTTP